MQMAMLASLQTLHDGDKEGATAAQASALPDGKPALSRTQQQHEDADSAAGTWATPGKQARQAAAAVTAAASEGQHPALTGAKADPAQAGAKADKHPAQAACRASAPWEAEVSVADRAHASKAMQQGIAQLRSAASPDVEDGPAARASLAAPSLQQKTSSPPGAAKQGGSIVKRMNEQSAALLTQAEAAGGSSTGVAPAAPPPPISTAPPSVSSHATLANTDAAPTPHVSKQGDYTPEPCERGGSSEGEEDEDIDIDALLGAGADVLHHLPHAVRAAVAARKAAAGHGAGVPAAPSNLAIQPQAREIGRTAADVGAAGSTVMWPPATDAPAAAVTPGVPASAQDNSRTTKVAHADGLQKEARPSFQADTELVRKGGATVKESHAAFSKRITPHEEGAPFCSRSTRKDAARQLACTLVTRWRHLPAGTTATLSRWATYLASSLECRGGGY